jgi:hypothetical protein
VHLLSADFTILASAHRWINSVHGFLLNAFADVNTLSINLLHGYHRARWRRSQAAWHGIGLVMTGSIERAKT